MSEMEDMMTRMARLNNEHRERITRAMIDKWLYPIPRHLIAFDDWTRDTLWMLKQATGIELTWFSGPRGSDYYLQVRRGCTILDTVRL